MRRALAISILVLLGASACGGSGSSGEGTSPTTEPAAVSADDVETPATVTDSSDPADTTGGDEADPDAGTLTFADHLSTGDCFDDQFDDQGDYDYSRPPIIVPCDQAHDNEVVLVTDHPAGPDDPFPGSDAFDGFFDETCIPAFEEFLGAPGDDTAVSGYYMSPVEEEWATGSRSFACILYLPAAQLAGSVEGAGGEVFPADLPADTPTPDGLTLQFINREIDSEPGDDDWGVDSEGLSLARFRHEAPTTEVKEAFLAEVSASGWTIERRDDFGGIGLETEFFDLRKDDRQLVVEVWELESGATSFEYFYRPSS